MHWAEFEKAAPEIAREAARLLERDELMLIGTLRKDGSPRISPVEVDITHGKLYSGMIWQSYKALDLQRDPRCTIHSVIRDRMAEGGEFKAQTRAVEITDLDERSRYGDALFERIGFKPEEPNYHLFAFEILSAAFFNTVGEYRHIYRWKVGEQVEKYRQDINDNKEPLE